MNEIKRAIKDDPIIKVFQKGGIFRRCCYWTENVEQKVQPYSRWLWEKWFGNIPTGYIIHHKDKNPLNDWIENYALMDLSEHTRLHGKNRDNFNPNLVQWNKFLIQHNEMDSYNRNHLKPTFNEIINLKQVCEMLGIHINIGRRWIREGKLKGYKLGRRWLFIRNEIIEEVKRYEKWHIK